MRRTTLLLVGALALSAPLVAACGGGDSKSATPTSSGGGHASLTVHAEDQLKFDKTAYSVAAGTVAVTYVNDGSTQHTLKVQGNSSFKLAVGSTDKGSVDLKPGTYTLYCDLPGHEAAGMKATLTVH